MSTLGIVGGGQLGRMLADAAKQLSVRTVVLDPTPNAPAGQVADKQVEGDFKEYDAVRSLAREADVLTFEIESANEQALLDLAAEGFPVHPTPATLAIIKDKLAQKTFLQERDIPTARFARVDSEIEAVDAGAALGYPFILKARTGGYDGRGNATITSESDIPQAMKRLGPNLYAEAFVPFEKELAVVAVRTQAGEIATYPVVETVHENHICTTVLMAGRVSPDIQAKAEHLAHQILEAFVGAGVFGIEMFLAGDEVLINEIAPRVHNSGHITMDACETSQFENHVRAVMHMPLGSTKMRVPAAVMVNILGERSGTANPTGVAEAESLGGVTVHLYGKHETRTARKMGHINAVGKDLEAVLAKAQEARKRVSI